MKHIKTIIAVTGLIGLVSIFLPYISEGPLSMSYWEFRKLPAGHSGVVNGPNQVYVALICFAVPMLMGVLAIVTKQLARWEAIVAGVFSLLAFSLSLVRSGLTGMSEGGETIATAYGGKLLFLAALVGVAGGVVGAVKPDRRTT